MLEILAAGHVTTLWIDRPSRRNALDGATIEALGAGIRRAAGDPDCRVLVIRGRGSTFSSGRDLADARRDAPLEDLLAYDRGWTDIIGGLASLEKPSVAVVEGHAVAGGFTLAMACDLVIAGRNARFGALEMRGGFPAAVNCAVLARVAGPRKALEYLLSADTFDAANLCAAGLINHVEAEGEALEARLADVTRRLVSLDPTAVALTKQMHRRASAMPFAEAIGVGGQLNTLLMASGRILAARDRHAARSKGGSDET